MPSCLAQSRPDGFFEPPVYHRNTYLRIRRDSPLLRHGRGGRSTARAFSSFLIEDSYEYRSPVEDTGQRRVVHRYEDGQRCRPITPIR
jgi:hypothetical protein